MLQSNLYHPQKTPASSSPEMQVALTFFFYLFKREILNTPVSHQPQVYHLKHVVIIQGLKEGRVTEETSRQLRGVDLQVKVADWRLKGLCLSQKNILAMAFYLVFCGCQSSCQF